MSVTITTLTVPTPNNAKTFLDVTNELKNMTIGKAVEEGRKLNQRYRSNIFVLGGIITRLRTDSKCPMDWDTICDQIDISYGTARAVEGIYKSLVKAEVWEHDLKDVGWTKLHLLTPIITKDNVAKWLDLARTRSRKELKKYIQKGDCYPDSNPQAVVVEPLSSNDEASPVTHVFVKYDNTPASPQTQKVQVQYEDNTSKQETPDHVLVLVKIVLGNIDLDPCSDLEDSGLSKSWHGRVFLHPPDDETDTWMKKFLDEYKAKRITAGIALVKACTARQWFSCLRGPICFVKDIENMVVYVGPKIEEELFVQTFVKLGPVWRQISDAAAKTTKKKGTL